MHGCFTIDMPMDAEVLGIQWQKEFPQLWASVNPNNRISTRHFRAIFTGEEYSSDRRLEFIDTLQLSHNGEILVVHFFEDLDRMGLPT